MRYICKVCGHIYDEDKEGKAFASLPADWVCPICKAPKSAFVLEGDTKTNSVNLDDISEEVKELSPAEISVIFSNLARGSEKQYKPEAQRLFSELANIFENKVPEVKNPSLEALANLVKQNLEKDYELTRAVAKADNDRGSQRFCAWGEKVTTMMASLIERYQKEGKSFLEHTNVWVCTVCGYIYIGDKAPELCPVCKVPAWKFEKMEGK